MRKSFFNVVIVARPAPREGEDPGKETVVVPPPAPDPEKFTPEQQAKVNAIIADERRKAQEVNRKLVSDLETLKQSKGLTEQEKVDLQSKIDNLTATYTTKEQQAQTEMQKLQKKYDTDISAKEQEAKSWRQRHENKLRTIDLREAAQLYGAINPTQVEKLLWDQTVVEEAIGEDGKPTGEFVTMVNFIGKDKEGKPVKLKLTPRDAVKAMTEIPDEYGNLFQSKAKGGLSKDPNQGGTAPGNIPNLETMTTQQYKQYREKIHEQMARKG